MQPLIGDWPRFKALIKQFLLSFFWSPFKWSGTIDRRFSEAPQDTGADRFTRATGYVAIGLIVLAYAFFPEKQLQNWLEVAASLVDNLSLSDFIQSLATNAALVAAAYLLVGWALRVPWQQLLLPLGYALHPVVVMFGWFGVFFPLMLSMGHGGGNLVKMVGWLPAAWFYFWSFLACWYNLYRAIKYRMNAHRFHPAFVPMMELALSVRAVAIALQGKTLILQLPPLPSRLVVLALPLAAVLFFGYRAIAAERKYVRVQSQNLRPKKREEFRRTQRNRLLYGVALITGVVAVFAAIGAI